MKTLVFAVFAGLAASGMAGAEAPLMSGLFVDHAVLQRDRPINVYGRAAAGEEVTVSLASASANAKADAKGAWSLTLPAMPAGGPHTLTARAALEDADRERRARRRCVAVLRAIQHGMAGAQ